MAKIQRAVLLKSIVHDDVESELEGDAAGLCLKAVHQTAGTSHLGVKPPTTRSE